MPLVTSFPASYSSITTTASSCSGDDQASRTHLNAHNSEPAGRAPHPADAVRRAHSIRLGDLPEWYHLGAMCSRCSHLGWLDRHRIERRFGKDRFVVTMEPLLRCTACNNRYDNDFKIAKMRR